jgi:hypothetical protein
MFSKLLLTDGTIKINLISEGTGFYLESWQPATAEPKNGGIWQDSPFVDGRRLAMKQYANITDTFTVSVSAFSQDDCIYHTQELRRLLRKAAAYWTTDWQDEPVWIEAQADCETCTRYAIIMDGRLANDDQPYAMPFVGMDGNKVAMVELPLVIEHQYWTAQAPMTAECVQVRNHNRYPWVMWLSPLSSASASMMYSPSTCFNNLPTADFTAEIWVYGDLNFGAGTGYLFWKSDWYAKIDAGRTISCFADFTGVDASLTTVNALPVNPQGWTHIQIMFEVANNRFSVAINGVAAGGAAVDGTINYVGDGATNLYIASTSAAGTDLFTNRATIGSRMTWTRISNTIRAVALGTRVYNKLPDYDANTICITNGSKTWAGAFGAPLAAPLWTNSFAQYYTGNILDATNTPKLGLLGVERYLENHTSYYCDFESVYSIPADREGCGLDYAFWNDVSLGTFGPNIIDANPSNLLPAAPAVGDLFYYGCGIHQGAAIPTAIVMEFTAAWSQSNSFAVEYWTGAAWAAVPRATNNGNFTNRILSIITEPPSNAAATTINGYQAYWYRLNFSNVAGGQYSILNGPALISSPFVEVEGAAITNSVYGDLPAIARISYNTQLQMLDLAAGPVYARKALMSLYSNPARDDVVSPRLNWFTPYINLTREVNLPSTKPRNQPGIQIVAIRAAGTYTSTYDVTAPATWITQVRVTIASTEFVTVAIYDYAAWCWQGKYRVMARMRDVLGGAAKGDVTVSAYLTAPYNTQIGGTYQNVPVLEELVDFGIIDLPAVGEGHSSERNITLVFTALTAGNHDINLHDLILLPIDEWNAEITHDPALAVSSYSPDFITNTFTLLDPVIYPKSPRSAIDANSPSSQSIPLDRNELYYVMGQRVSMSNSHPILQANTQQKLFMLQGYWWQIISATNVTWLYPYYFARAWTLEKQERYESMRGDR